MWSNVRGNIPCLKTLLYIFSSLSFCSLVFSTCSELLKFANVRIESASKAAEGFSNDYLTMVVFLFFLVKLSCFYLFLTLIRGFVAIVGGKTCMYYGKLFNAPGENAVPQGHWIITLYYDRFKICERLNDWPINVNLIKCFSKFSLLWSINKKKEI